MDKLKELGDKRNVPEGVQFDSIALIDEIQKKMKVMKHNLNQVMPSGGAEVQKADPFHQRFEYTNLTEVDIFAANQPLRVRLDMDEKCLPVKLLIRCKRDTYAEEFEKALPEDLRIYFSLNTKEPDEKDCEMMITQADIQ